MSGINLFFLKSIVSGPGQNFFAKISAFLGKYSTYFLIFSTELVWQIIGSFFGLFFNLNIFLTELSFNALHPRPYTVSVGIPTIPPSFNLFTA